MALSASYVNGQFLEDALKNTVAFDLDGTINCALFKENQTGADKDASETYNVSQWASATFECAATGTYAAGGSALTSPTLASASGTLTYDSNAGGDLAWTGCTWADGSAPQCCLLYDTTVSNRVIAAIRFGAADLPVTAGSFTITWNSAGIWYATY